MISSGKRRKERNKEKTEKGKGIYYEKEGEIVIKKIQQKEKQKKESVIKKNQRRENDFSNKKRTKKINVDKTLERKANRYGKKNHNEFVFIKRKGIMKREIGNHKVIRKKQCRAKKQSQ